MITETTPAVVEPGKPLKEPSPPAARFEHLAGNEAEMAKQVYAPRLSEAEYAEFMAKDRDHQEWFRKYLLEIVERDYSKPAKTKAVRGMSLIRRVAAPGIADPAGILAEAMLAGKVTIAVLTSEIGLVQRRKGQHPCSTDAVRRILSRETRRPSPAIMNAAIEVLGIGPDKAELIRFGMR